MGEGGAPPGEGSGARSGEHRSCFNCCRFCYWRENNHYFEPRSLLSRTDASAHPRSGLDSQGSTLSQLDQASAMSSIQSILPDLPSAFLLAALAHPAFAAPDASIAAERIIQAVLEGAVPGELQPLLEGGSSVAQQGMIATTELVQPEVNEEEDEFLAMARRRRGADVNGNGGDEIATAFNFGKLSLGKRELP